MNNSQSIERLSRIERTLGKDYTLYIIWNKKKQKWYLPEYTIAGLPRGIFINLEEARKYLHDDDHIVTDFCFKDGALHELKRLEELEISELFVSKLRQLIYVHIINNKILQEQLEQTYGQNS